jgi:hypothetical protein
MLFGEFPQTLRGKGFLHHATAHAAVILTFSARDLLTISVFWSQARVWQMH